MFVNARRMTARLWWVPFLAAAMSEPMPDVSLQTGGEANVVVEAGRGLAENTGTQLLITSCTAGMGENGGGNTAEGGFPGNDAYMYDGVMVGDGIEYRDLAMTSHTLDMIAGAPEGVQTTFELDTTSGSPEIKFLSRTAGPDGPLASV